MARKRYKPEEIVAKLRQVDVLVSQGQGLRASEVCDLQWPQIELESGRMHVRTAKNGRPSVYPIRGDEIRALRGLRHENPTAAHAPPSDFTISSAGSAKPLACRSKCIRTCSGMPAAISSPMTDTTPEPCKHYLGHKNIQHTVRYTELSPDRFRDFWR
jgi:integrase